MSPLAESIVAPDVLTPVGQTDVRASSLVLSTSCVLFVFGKREVRDRHSICEPDAIDRAIEFKAVPVHAAGLDAQDYGLAVALAHVDRRASVWG